MSSFCCCDCKELSTGAGASSGRGPDRLRRRSIRHPTKKKDDDDDDVCSYSWRRRIDQATCRIIHTGRHKGLRARDGVGARWNKWNRVERELRTVDCQSKKTTKAGPTESESAPCRCQPSTSSLVHSRSKRQKMARVSILP